MTSPKPGDLTPVDSIEEAKEKYVHNIKTFKPKLDKGIGSEVEMFVTNEHGALTRANGQRLLLALSNRINTIADPNSAQLVSERYAGQDWYTGIQGPEQGVFSWEPGQQLEFAASVSGSPAEVVDKNRWMLDLVRHAANEIGHRVSFVGYDEKYANQVQHTPRTRGWIWDKFIRQFRDRNMQRAIRMVHYGTSGFQLTSNSGGENYHEYHDAALLGDSIIAIKFNKNHNRLDAVGLYAEQYPVQFQPIVEAWRAPTVEATVGFVMDRLWKLEVPFWNPDHYDLDYYELTELTDQGRPQTVGYFVDKGEYTYQDLANAMGFFYTSAAQRKFETGFHEFRRPDLTDSLKDQFAMTDFIYTIQSDDDARQTFLKSADFITQEDILQIDRAAHYWNRPAALMWPVTSENVTIRHFVDTAFGDRSLDGLRAHRTISLPPDLKVRDAPAQISSLSESIVDTAEPLSGSAAVVALLDTGDQVTIRSNGATATNGSALHDSAPGGADEAVPAEAVGVDLDLVNSATAAAHGGRSTALQPSTPRVGGTRRVARQDHAAN